MKAIRAITTDHQDNREEARRMSLRFPGAGELAPDFTLPATDGTTVHLADYPKPVEMVFLRHLG